MSESILLHRLEGVRRRVKLFGVLQGIGIVVAAAVGLVLTATLLDYLLNLPPFPRCTIILASLIFLGYLLTQYVINPALAHLGLSDVAGRLENVFPQFDDRLRSGVNFVSNPNPGSDAMQHRVVAQAEEIIGRVDLNRAVETKPVVHSFAAAVASIVIVVALGTLVGHDYLKPAFSRLINPFSTEQWPKRVEIGSFTLPDKVPVGGHVDLRLRLDKGDKSSREVRVYYQYGDGREESQIMTRDPDGFYTASLDARIDADAASGIMKVRAECADDQTETRSIAVIPRLVATDVQLSVAPPPYVTAPSTLVELAAVPAVVTRGSTITMTVAFNKSLDPKKPVTLSPGAEDTPGHNALPVTTFKISGSTAVAVWQARVSSTFQIHAVDADGFTSADPSEYQIIVREDQMPSIQISRPGRDEECTPQAVVALRALAEDDFAINSAKLMGKLTTSDKTLPLSPADLVRNGQPVPGITWTPQESSSDRKRWQIDYPWDLSKTALKPGDVIEYYMEVTDNYLLDGQTHPPVDSGKYHVRILSQEQFTALINDQIATIQKQVVDLKSTEVGLKEEVGDLRQSTANQKEFSHMDRLQAQDLTARQATAAAQAKQLADALAHIADRLDENKSTDPDLKNLATGARADLNDLAEHPMKDAANQIDNARNQHDNPRDPQDQRQKSQADRNDNLAKAETNQGDAADKLDQIATRMGQTGGLPAAIDNFKKILDEQRDVDKTSDKIGLNNLGKTPDQMDPKDAQDSKANADHQAALSNRTAAALQQLGENAKRADKVDPADAQAMRQAQTTGQQQDIPGQMQQSADAQRQNQQASAQQAQAQVEIGLQMMLRQLEEAQNRKLEELARQLADLLQQTDALVRQQAGLNFANLALQGPDAVAKIDKQALAEIVTDAQIDLKNLPAAIDTGMQSRMQEQTQRNAVSAAKSAQALPDGAEIATVFNRAAQKMSRAILSLRDDDSPQIQRLTDAYTPPQAEALAALLKARKLLQDQADKVNAKLDQQHRDTIRVALEKILAGQKLLDADTLALDKSWQADAGQLGHADAIRLGQLPGQQGELSDSVGKLEEPLNTLGGTVYVWAITDVKNTMGQVKDDLAKPDTGITTQAEQTRVEDQLTAMIESLKIEPKKSQFGQRSGPSGKGQQSGPPQLPPEAELRLLKALQQAVNKSTAAIDDQGNKTAPVLVALGDRQAQLRTLLDQLLQKASQGQVRLGDDPGPDERVPEESADNQGNQDPLDQQLQGDLLNSTQPDADQMQQSVELTGKRMARSHVRLEKNKDPGKVTQDVQKHILSGLDDLIAMARQQQSQSQPQSGNPQGEPQQQPQPQPGGDPKNSGNKGQQPPQPKGGTSPATASVARTGDPHAAAGDDPSVQLIKEWGNISPRNRADVTEVSSEKPLEKYKDLVDDYYRALAVKAADNDNNNGH